MRLSRKIRRTHFIAAASLSAMMAIVTAAFAGAPEPACPSGYTCGPIWICQTDDPLDGIDGTCGGHWCQHHLPPPNNCHALDPGEFDLAIPEDPPPTPSSTLDHCDDARSWVYEWASGHGSCKDVTGGYDPDCVDEMASDGFEYQYPECL